MAEDDLPYTENLQPYAIDVILKYVCLAYVLSIVVNDLVAVLCGVKTDSSGDRESIDGGMCCQAIFCRWTILHGIA